MEELKTTPNEPGVSAPALAAKALDQELNGAGASPSLSDQAPVNDLTSMVVKKKKKAPEVNETGKRKADDDVGSSSEKKMKVDETSQP